MTQAELMAIGRLEGRVGSLEQQFSRMDSKLDRILDQVSEDRQSVVEMRIEDLQRELDHRKSLRPKAKSGGIVKSMLPWLLGIIGAVGAGVATWLTAG